MALMDILAGAQGGQFFANTGKCVGLDAEAAAKALSALCPAIAAQLRAKSEEDPQTFEGLLELLEDEGGDSVLDDPEELASGEAIRDGNAILDDIYGSREAAIREMRKLAGEVPETSLGKLAAIGATAVLGGLSRSNAPMPLAGAAPLAGGLLGTIVSELVKGAVQGATRTLAPRKRRRRRTYSSYFGKKRKRTTRKRSSQRTPSLEDIFGEILGTRRR